MLTPDSYKFAEEGMNSSKMKRKKLSQNAYPEILLLKRDRLVNIFLEKIKNSTLFLRKPLNLKSRHYQIINDLSIPYISPINYKYSTKFLWISANVLDYLLSKLNKFNFIEPNSIYSFLNSVIQSLAIIMLVFATTISMVFPIG